MITATSTPYLRIRYAMDEWLVSHPEFLARFHEPPVTFEQMDRFRRAICLLIERPLPKYPAEVQRQLERMKDKYEYLGRLYFHARVSEKLGIDVQELENLYRGDEVQRAKYRELVDTYDEVLRHAPAVIVGEDGGLRRVIAGSLGILICLLAALLYFGAHT